MTVPAQDPRAQLRADGGIAQLRVKLGAAVRVGPAGQVFAAGLAQHGAGGVRVQLDGPIAGVDRGPAALLAMVDMRLEVRVVHRLARIQGGPEHARGGFHHQLDVGRGAASGGAQLLAGVVPDLILKSVHLPGGREHHVVDPSPGGVGGPLARAAQPDLGLEFPHGVRDGPLDPRGLGLRRCDPGQESSL